MTATKTLLEVLQRHYLKPGAFPGGIFLPECGINGNGGQSRADALYVGFTSTSGRLLVGHELKVSRSDWRKELDTAGKADFWADNCHQWFIVAPGPDIVPAEEIPHGWGLMYPSARTKTRMQIVVKPETHKDRVPSWTAVRSIMARLDTLQHGRVAEVQRSALDDARAQAQREYEGRNRDKTLTQEQRERLDTLERIENALGSKIGYAWNDDNQVRPELAAAALDLVLAAEKITPAGVGHASHTLRNAAEVLLQGLDDYDAAHTTLLALAGRKR